MAPKQEGSEPLSLPSVAVQAGGADSKVPRICLNPCVHVPTHLCVQAGWQGPFRDDIQLLTPLSLGF